MADPTDDDIIRSIDPLIIKVVSQYLPKRYRSDADDVAQIARLKAWQAIRRFDPARGTRLSTYLARVVMNAVIDSVRSIARQKHCVPIPTTHAAPADVLAIEKLAAAILANPHRYMSDRPASLVPLADLSNRQIGAKLGMTPKSAADAKTRLRNRLRELASDV